MKNKEKFNPFFIVGSGRSGTTVLRAMLNAHPRLCVPHESDFCYYGKLFASGGRLSNEEKTKLAALFANTSEDSGWGLTQDEINTSIMKDSIVNFGDAHFSLFQSYTKSDLENVVLGIKRPMLIFLIGRLQEYYPESKIVHLVRDGRDVCLSYRQVHEKLESPFGPRGVIASALYWQVGLDELKLGKGGGSVLELRYEDLLSDPEVVLSGLCDHVGVEFEGERMLNYREQENADSLVLAKDKAGHHENVLSGLMAKNTNKYLEQMSVLERTLFEVFAVDGLKRYNYSIHTPNWLLLVCSPLRLVGNFVARAFNRKRYERRERALLKRWNQEF